MDRRKYTREPLDLSQSVDMMLADICGRVAALDDERGKLVETANYLAEHYERPAPYPQPRKMHAADLEQPGKS